MDKREYLRVVQFGTVTELIFAVRFFADCKMNMKMLDRKIDARRATKCELVSKKKPTFRFGPKFFTKLNMMPAVSIEVRESRSQIRKTCYGFRDRLTGERVYLRVDPGSVVEFRDSPCGYLLGTRYLIPNIDRMKSPRWDKVSRLMTRLLSREGIIVSATHVAKYKRSTKPRSKLAKRMVDLRNEYVSMRDLKRRKWKRFRK